MQVCMEVFLSIILHNLHHLQYVSHVGSCAVGEFLCREYWAYAP